MELEIKHLVPYLPYKLAFLIEWSDQLKHREILYSIDLKNNQIGTGADSFFTLGLEDNFKPILRPMSDLTKEIEVNGEKFVPIEKLKEIYVTNLLAENNTIYLDQKGDVQLNVLVFGIIRDHLFEWHFDVFDLIGNNLAIKHK